MNPIQRISNLWHAAFAVVTISAMTGLILVGASTVSRAATCEPGSVSYQLAHRVALEDFLTSPITGATRAEAGRITLSSLLDEVTGRTSSGYLSRLRIRESYSRILSEFGPLVRETVYELETDANCQSFIIRNVQVSAPLAIGAPDPVRTLVVRSGISAFLKSKPNAEPFPINTHSGNYSIRVHEPELCTDGASASLNIVRTHHASTGLVSRVSSFQIDLARGQVLREDVHWGRFLPSMCP